MGRIERVSLWIMSLFYFAAGVNHFLNPQAYLAMMPPWLPAPEFMNSFSGLAEIVLAIGLHLRALRRWAALGIIALLVAVVPANIYVAIHDLPIFGREQGFGTGNWIRVAFQPVLILWAWWHYRRTTNSPPSNVAPLIRTSKT